MNVEHRNFMKKIYIGNKLKNHSLFRKEILINQIKYLFSNGVTVHDYLQKKAFPSRPFELRGSEKFFDVVKFNNLELVKQALNRNPKYSEQFDYCFQTPFHWAAKLGYFDVLKLLLKSSKKCNTYDRKLRTPLYFAALNNHKKCVELLLENGGNSNLCDIDGQKPEDVTEDYIIQILLKSNPEKPFSEIIGVPSKKKY